MLNRNHRTLSAHFHRLNLGTRSLALVVGFNKGAQTLHTRHAAPVAMRAGIVGGYPAEPQPMGRIGIPSIPGSPSVSSWLIASPAIHPRVDSGADRRSPNQWQARSVGLPCQRGAKTGADATQRLAKRGQTARKPGAGRERQQTARVAGMSWPAILSPVSAPGAVAGG